ncbi:MAG: DEAD/DEAH box helicase family protein [Candidatus Poribacteria bacterium]|nr:DEAD/DEAH box helicase family protein [Candidatus Poribacteria bacterium]
MTSKTVASVEDPPTEAEKNSFDVVLERIRRESTGRDGSVETRRRGDMFENLIRQFLLTDAIYSQEFEGVWLWGDNGCPGRREVLGSLNKPDNRKDYGIDLVARRHDGTLVGIQCKCYDDDKRLQKSDVSEFIALLGSKKSGKRIFDSGIFVWTGLEITTGAQLIIDNNSCGVLDRSVLRGSAVDWASLLPGRTPRQRKKFEPRQHQRKAIEAVLAGLRTDDRGKLVMACGTGKTFTTLKIAEERVGAGGTILYLVPSISLLQQSMREWAEQSDILHRYVAVCSDTKVGRDDEDASLAELEIRPTTDPAEIADVLQRRNKERMTVVFSTYQSVRRVGEAQRKCRVMFDLLIADEAHRTTGLVRAEAEREAAGTGTVDGDDEKKRARGRPPATPASKPAAKRVAVDDEGEISGFTYIHSNANIPAASRLYVTATPKIYAPASREKARAQDTEVYSMDDVETYGEEFYKLMFDEAIGMGLLSDYKVVVMTVEEEGVASITRRAVDAAAKDGDGLDVNLPMVAKWVGCWKGLVDPDKEEAGKLVVGRNNGSRGGTTGNDREKRRTQPLQRVIAFTQSIKQSKRFKQSFEDVVGQIPTPFEATPRTDHVDGTQNSLNRRRKLDWLEDSHNAAGECRILSNARCLSEGVDVPALDAVVFLNPRDSIIDVIQAVGRVMRKAEGKQYGYVVLPVAIPAGSDPSTILDNKDSYRVVWNVIRALRAHDSKRWEQKMIDGNILSEINWGSEPCVDCQAGICDRHGPRKDCQDCEAEFAGSGKPCKKHAPFMAVDIPEHLIRSKIVEKVSDRRYLEEWAKDIAHIISSTTARIDDLYKHDESIRGELDVFHTGLKKIINDTITREDAIDMLAQHMVMGRVFDALFAGGEKEGAAGGRFTSHNPVSRAMDTVLMSLREKGLEAEMEKLEKFYEEVESRVVGVKTHGGRQRVIHELYDKFFNHAFEKEAERLGIVYTPIELVDFVLKSSDYLMRENFGRGLTSKDVNIIDPFTGTGSFITRLMSEELGLISDRDLLHKYRNSLFASEIVLMAYYIAAVNCESTFMERAGRYVPFEGITLTDTFHPKNLDDQWDEGVFTDTQKRIERQRKSKITLVVGNPPWSMGQDDYDKSNPNTVYPVIRKRVTDTYLKRTKKANPGISLTRSAYDSYILALRWASDRIGESGMIGFVTNGSFISSNTGAGVRACLQEEFTDVWVFDLLGKKGVKGHGRNVFEYPGVSAGGTTAQVAIVILVKNPNKEKCAIHYRALTEVDYSGPDKRAKVSELSSVEGIHDWQIIEPDDHYDWIGQRSGEFSRYLPMGSKEAKRGQGNAVFRTYSNGVSTARDVWAYNTSKNELIRNMKRHIEYCNEHIMEKPKRVDSKRGKWDSDLSRNLKKFGRQKFTKHKIRQSLYRPFFKQLLYFE